MKKAILSVILVASLSACQTTTSTNSTSSPSTTVVSSQGTTLTNQQIGAAGQAVSANLKDPHSAQWGPIKGAVLTYADGSTRLAACGMVNAKNSYGGYVGSRMYFVLYNDNGTALAANVADASYICRNYKIV